ncbi:MAG TPA: hypothetical protein VGV67_10310, partial [Solirubrobacteraceae bacterium]|nr:hypothetical protein [Solirubrobacteraceae bacterium]
MTLARSTLGSKRVTSAYHASTAASAQRRPRAPTWITRSSTMAPATTTAMFAPLTATRWVSPVSR